MADETAIDDSGFTMEQGLLDHETVGELIVNEVEEAKTKLGLEAKLFPETRFRAGKAIVWGGPVTLSKDDVAAVLTEHHPICLHQRKRAEVLAITGGKDGGVKVKFVAVADEPAKEDAPAEGAGEEEAAAEPDEEATT